MTKYNPENRIDWEEGRWGVEYSRHDDTWAYLLSPEGGRCQSGPILSPAAEKLARQNNGESDD